MTNKITHIDYWGQTRVFEIVDDFPDGYQVWNIGRQNFPYARYIPLCETNGNHRINPDTLKALKLPTEKQAAAILNAAGWHTVNKKNYQNI